ncbi:GvpL/GvpF family gas vesicle protein [Metabacillus idriensis]|uniref:GvpL/GvpF family gas vesicle protein n=1 Tax=Metabacillus idriensis TaxID=324768 RepID=UPI003D2B4DD9
MGVIPEKNGLYIFCIAENKSIGKSESIYFAGRERDLIFLPYREMVLAAAIVPFNLRPFKENLLMHQKIIGSLLETSDTVFPFSFGHVFRSNKEAVSLLQRLYPQQEYLMECGKRFENNEDDEAKLLSEKFYEASKGAGDHKAAVYIHLKNVQIKGSQVPSSSYLRCRIEDVSGFVIGN